MTDPDLAEFDQIHPAVGRLREQIHRLVIGQDVAVEHLTAAMLVGGHVLLIGVPGLAKTMLVRATAGALGWRFSRIQFTPDLMPSDVIGTDLIQENAATGHRELRFAPGPVFTNLLLADEINRTPPRTQAALLEAMAERQVTAGGRTMMLDEPFVVVATQNPIEQEGTYPLPEAQLDRFMFSITMQYPPPEDERRIVSEVEPDGRAAMKVDPVLRADEAVRM
ncbi:MAG: AAA family ATPase, partial [Phycisphaeraceae bacterium]